MMSGNPGFLNLGTRRQKEKSPSGQWRGQGCSILKEECVEPMTHTGHLGTLCLTVIKKLENPACTCSGRVCLLIFRHLQSGCKGCAWYMRYWFKAHTSLQHYLQLERLISKLVLKASLHLAIPFFSPGNCFQRWDL